MWYQEPKWRSRLIAEAALMHERFRGFRLVRTQDGSLRWIGVLNPTPDSEFVVSLTYPADYPYREPKLRVERPALQGGAPHVYNDGSLCIHRRSWDPSRGTAVSEVPLIAAWLVAYQAWWRHGVPF